VPRSQWIAKDQTPKWRWWYRFERSDVFAVLLLVGWCALGIVKITHDVREYRAQQAALTAFATRFPAETMRLFPDAGTPVAKIPYIPGSERWLIGEMAGYLLTVAVLAAGCGRVRRRRVSLEVKWLHSTERRSAAGRRARPLSPPDAAPGNVAADRLSAIVWNDRVVRREKELV
jgi:hypothetical protein